MLAGYFSRSKSCLFPFCLLCLYMYLCFVTYVKYIEVWDIVNGLLFEFLQFRPSVKGKQSFRPCLALVAFTVMLTELLSAPLLCSSADTKEA